MSEQMEKLVKGIVHDIEMYHRWASQGTTHHDTSQRIARGIITRIGKAVLAGGCPGLDKLLGVVGRGNGYYDTTCWDDGTGDVELWIENHDIDRRDISGFREPLKFIALRKEEGK